MYGADFSRSEDDFLYGLDLLNAGYFWEAHVYFERLWTSADSLLQADFFQGLVQLSAAFVKRRQGNSVGERKLLLKSLSKFKRVCDSAGVIYQGLVLSVLIGQIERRLSGGEVERP